MTAGSPFAAAHTDDSGGAAADPGAAGAGHGEKARTAPSPPRDTRERLK